MITIQDGSKVVDINQNRWTPFSLELVFKDYDLTGSAFACQVRESYDGASLTQEITVSAITTLGSDTSITLSISEAAMEALPAAPVLGDALCLVWDFHLTPSGGIKQRIFKGKFNVLGGATQ